MRESEGRPRGPSSPVVLSLYFLLTPHLWFSLHGQGLPESTLQCFILCPTVLFRIFKRLTPLLRLRLDPAQTCALKEFLALDQDGSFFLSQHTHTAALRAGPRCFPARVPRYSRSRILCIGLGLVGFEYMGQVLHLPGSLLFSSCLPLSFPPHGPATHSDAQCSAAQCLPWRLTGG